MVASTSVREEQLNKRREDLRRSRLEGLSPRRPEQQFDSVIFTSAALREYVGTQGS